MDKKEVKKNKNKNLKQLIEKNLDRVIFEYKPPTTIDLTKNAEVCREVTKSSCWRPDIYLDYGCVACSINKNCACPIKKMIKKEPSKRRKK
jgi:hypothetical protein